MVDSYFIQGRLNSEELAQAKKDLSHSRLTDREKDILRNILNNVWISDMVKEYHLPRQNIHLYFQKALVKIWRQKGSRKWIKSLSKGKIEEWNVSLARPFSGK